MNPASALEVWGGEERTVDRVGDVLFNQMARNGHDVRIVLTSGTTLRSMIP